MSLITIKTVSKTVKHTFLMRHNINFACVWVDVDAAHLAERCRLQFSVVIRRRRESPSLKTSAVQELRQNSPVLFVLSHFSIDLIPQFITSSADLMRLGKSFVRVIWTHRAAGGPVAEVKTLIQIIWVNKYNILSGRWTQFQTSGGFQLVLRV